MKACSHLEVVIKSIIKPFDGRSRTIAGVCRQCGEEVQRVQSANEIKVTHIPETQWQ